MIRSTRKAILLSLCLLALAGSGRALGQSVPRKPGPKADRYVVDYRTMQSPSWKANFPNLGRYEVLSPATPNVRPPKVPQLSVMISRLSSKAATASSSSMPISREKPTASIEMIVAS